MSGHSPQKIVIKTPVLFYSEHIRFELRNKNSIRQWLHNLIKTEGYTLGNISFIFCSDKYLHKINLQYLNHDDYTDIITFDNANAKGIVESDIFISIQRVKENAKALKIPFRDELHRVIAHGVLHLCGYKDKTPDAKRTMTTKEDYYLSLRPFL